MILRAQECTERAIEARELARQTKRHATKAALVQAAAYWSALAEQELRLSTPVQTHPVSMPVFRVLGRRRDRLISRIARRECAI